MIAATQRLSGEVLLLGAVRGLVSETPPLLAALDRFGPSAVGVGVSREELAGLNEHFVGRPTEPLVPLSSLEVAEAHGLSRFGEVRVPHPAILAVLDWARSGGRAVEPLDPPDERFAELFTDHISYFELVRRTLRERRLSRAPLSADSAEAFAESWHRSLSDGRGSRQLNRARESALAEAARRLSLVHGRIAVVVDRERFDGVRAQFAGGA